VPPMGYKHSAETRRRMSEAAKGNKNGSGCPRIIRHEVLRPSNVVYSETSFSFARAWSIWSYALVAMAAVVSALPVSASDS
jgi:hypothetical protein